MISKPSGKSRHIHGGVELPPPAELRIVRYGENSGFYLFCCRADGDEVTDTSRGSSEEAMAQAEWEFRVRSDEWVVIAGG